MTLYLAAIVAALGATVLSACGSNAGSKEACNVSCLRPGLFTVTGAPTGEELCDATIAASTEAGTMTFQRFDHGDSGASCSYQAPSALAEPFSVTVSAPGFRAASFQVTLVPGACCDSDSPSSFALAPE